MQRWLATAQTISSTIQFSESMSTSQLLSLVLSLKTFNSFEPTAWAVFRGIVAVYACIGIAVFSAYSGYIAFQLHSSQAYTINDVILGSTQCNDDAFQLGSICVTAHTMVSRLQVLRISIY